VAINGLNDEFSIVNNDHQAYEDASGLKERSSRDTPTRSIGTGMRVNGEQHIR